jgi:proteasome lid subunit RPN8/RPN11
MLRIAQAHLDVIRNHAQTEYPRECCGVLVGEMDGADKVVREVIPCRNAHASPQKRYEIDPAELVRIQREHRTAGNGIVGFYHSHPEHAAMWSERDLADAHWTGCSYVITSVMNGQAVETRSFALTGVEGEKAFLEEALDTE